MANANPNSARERLVNLAAVGLAVALALTPSFVVPCSHAITAFGGASMPMRCHWTFKVERLLAAAALIASASLFAARHAEARRAAGRTLVLLAALVFAVTQEWGIGLCGSPEMACHRTAHWLWLWAALLAAEGLALALTRKSSAAQAPADPWEVAGSTERSAAP